MKKMKSSSRAQKEKRAARRARERAIVMPPRTGEVTAAERMIDNLAKPEVQRAVGLVVSKVVIPFFEALAEALVPKRGEHIQENETIEGWLLGKGATTRLLPTSAFVDVGQHDATSVSGAPPWAKLCPCGFSDVEAAGHDMRGRTHMRACPKYVEPPLIEPAPPLIDQREPNKDAN